MPRTTGAGMSTGRTARMGLVLAACLAALSARGADSMTVVGAAPDSVAATQNASPASSASEAAAVQPVPVDPQQLAGRYAAFAGSDENAKSLVTGLHKGSTVTLAPRGDPESSEPVSFTPPTRPMSYREVSRALSMVKAQLAAQGIARPTPDQLRIALMGGSFTDGMQTVATSGVLQLRRRGMSWGEIAHALNVSVSARMGQGPVR